MLINTAALLQEVGSILDSFFSPYLISNSCGSYFLNISSISQFLLILTQISLLMKTIIIFSLDYSNTFFTNFPGPLGLPLSCLLSDLSKTQT